MLLMLHLYAYTLLFGGVLLILLGWQQRKCWTLIWQLNGWRGIVQQPLLWLLICIYLEPKSILDTITRLRPWLRRPLAVVVGTRVMLYIDDPESMECILNAPECLDKTFMQDGFFARRGLLHARGQKWKLRRKQLNPAFSHNIVVSFFDVFNDVGNQLLTKFANTPNLSGNNVRYKDVEDMLSRAVLEVSCLTIMGTATSFTQTDQANIATTYKRLLEISAMKIVKPWLQIDFLHRLLNRRTYDESLKCNKLLEQFVAQIIERKHEEWQTSKDAAKHSMVSDYAEWGTTSNDRSASESAANRIFIEQIFSLAAVGELTLQDIIDEAQSMVLVSFETVSNSIIIALLCLAMEPAMNGDCQRRLREEIAQVLPQNGKVDAIELEHLQQMTYLDAFVNESLRLLATVPMNLRHVSRDFQMRRKSTTSTTTTTTSSSNSNKIDDNVKLCTVPGNSIIVLDTFNMQREPMWWGTNARDFEPRRFLGQPPMPQQHSYCFLPFSKGLRTCIGRRYSIFVMKIFLLKLVATFEFRTAQKLHELRFVEGISLKFRNVDDITFDIKKVPLI